ncbi:MAG: thioredoxin domain-containing protein [Candidatus Pacearchaeota archaeon]|jgi:thiol-disulfide isomerase/thioredoxin
MDKINKILLFLILILFLNLFLVYAQLGNLDLNSDPDYLKNSNIFSTCNENGCAPNPNYDKTKPSYYGTELGLSDMKDIEVSEGSAIMVDNHEKIVFNKDNNIKIKGNEYNAKSGAEFKFDKDGNLIEGTTFTVSKAGVVNLHGIPKNLPEGTIVTYGKDKLVSIKYPAGSKLENPDLTKVDKVASAGARFEIESIDGNGFKLPTPKEDNFKGKLIQQFDSEGKMRTFSNDEIEISAGIKFGAKDIESEIFFDGLEHKEATSNYVSIGENNIITGKNDIGKGVPLSFLPENRFLVGMNEKNPVKVFAGSEDGPGKLEIINKGEEYPHLITTENFRIENGNAVPLKSGKDSKGNPSVKFDRSVTASENPSSYPFQMKFLDKEGNSLLRARDSNGEVVIKDNKVMDLISFMDENGKFENFKFDEAVIRKLPSSYFESDELGTISPPEDELGTVAPPELEKEDEETPTFTNIPTPEVSPPVVTPPTQTNPPEKPLIEDISQKFKPLESYNGFFATDSSGNLQIDQNGIPKPANGVRILGNDILNMNNPNSEVLVKFGATWCGPCRNLDAQIEGWVSNPEYKKTFVLIDVDENPALAKSLGFTGGTIPQTNKFIGGVNQNTPWR